MIREVEKESRITNLINNIEHIIMGKHDKIELIITALLAGGHVLIEDVPGVGKTKLIASLAASCGGSFNRLQMTPDVMPGDITGFTLIDAATKELQFKKGVAFCNFLLADEINRSSPKSQSALLEVMEENQISIDGITYELPQPFMVLATQNMVETYGTYHLPEAQMDRFIMKLNMGYPSKEAEYDILIRNSSINPKNLSKVVSVDDILALKREVESVTASPSLLQYIIEIVNVTRAHEGIKLGISPRGSLAILQASKAFAYIQGRNYIIPDDVKYLAQYVLSHRIILTPHGKSMFNNNEEAINSIISSVRVPV